MVRPVVRFVREMYETQVWADEEADAELRRVVAERPRPARRRSFLRSRRLQAAVAAGGRLAALLGLLFPVAFAVGWLFQAGQLLGFGVPLALVTPDPVQLAVSAATFTVLLSAVFAFMLGLHGAYARIGPRWRARIYMVQLPVSVVLAVLFLLGFDFGLDVELVLFFYFVVIRVGAIVCIGAKRELVETLSWILTPRLGDGASPWIAEMERPRAPQLDFFCSASRGRADLV